MPIPNSSLTASGLVIPPSLLASALAEEVVVVVLAGSMLFSQQLGKQWNGIALPYTIWMMP